MPVRGAHTIIHEAVMAWPGVTAHPHRFGGTEYRLGQRELGHIHGDGLVDIPFPRRVRDEIVAAGLAQPHHIMPETGWVSCYIQNPEDIPRAIALLERSFTLAQQKWPGKQGAAEEREEDET